MRMRRVLALAGVLSLSGAAGAASEDIWAAVGTVDFGQVHRRAPINALPPVTDQAAAAWRAELSGGVRAIPPTTFYNSLKTGLIPTTVNLAKTGGRLIGYGAVMQIGMFAMNKALEAAFNEIKNEANPNSTVSQFKNCLANGLATQQQLNHATVCDYAYGPPNVVVPGRYPVASTGNTGPDWAQEYWYRAGSDYFLVEIYRGSSTYGFTSSTSSGACSHTMSGLTKDRVVNWLAWFNDCMSTKTVKYPVTLNDYIEGGRIGGRDIVADPELKTLLRDALAKHFENPNTGPNFGGVSPIFPGVEPMTAPSKGQALGRPANQTDDLDRDGWSDLEEVLRGSDPNDPQSKPNPLRDTDGDGVPDATEDRLGTDPYDPESKPAPDQLTDLDGDGIPDADDSDRDGDGVPNEIDPNPDNKDIPVKCSAGFETSEDGLTCVPKKDPPKCPEGKKLDESTPPVCVADNDPKKPVDDDCGVFTVARLMSHTGGFLRDVVFPCESDYGWITEITSLASTKFPFSLTSSLGNVVNYTGVSDRSAALPDKLGPFDLNWSWLVPLITVVGLLFKAFIGWIAIDILLSRLSGQVVIK